MRRAFTLFLFCVCHLSFCSCVQWSMQSARQRAGSKKLPQSQHPSCTQTPLKLFVLLADDGVRDDHRGGEGGVGDHNGDDGAVAYDDNDDVFYYDDNDQEERDCFYLFITTPEGHVSIQLAKINLISVRHRTY